MSNEQEREQIPLILNMPHLVSPLTKIISGLVTILFWSFFSYLWIPMMILVAGLLGYHSNRELSYVQQMGNFKHLTFSYMMIVLALGGSLLMWALQEYLRFRNLNRRRRPVPVELSDLAHYTSMKERDLAEWQSSRRMVAYHDENGVMLQFATSASDEVLLSA